MQLSCKLFAPGIVSYTLRVTVRPLMDVDPGGLALGGDRERSLQ